MAIYTISLLVVLLVVGGVLSRPTENFGSLFRKEDSELDHKSSKLGTPLELESDKSTSRDAQRRSRGGTVTIHCQTLECLKQLQDFLQNLPDGYKLPGSRW